MNALQMTVSTKLRAGFTSEFRVISVLKSDGDRPGNRWRCREPYIFWIQDRHSKPYIGYRIRQNYIKITRLTST
jgi:hypothetical protein